MDSDRVRLWVLGVLTVSFLGYTIILYTQRPQKGVEEPKMSALAEKGKMLWQQKNCTSCHQIYGLGGHLGPDLTNVTSQRSPEYIEAFLKSGTNVMPNFHLTQEEMDALQAFLKTVDESGKSDPRIFKLNLDGTITEKDN